MANLNATQSPQDEYSTPIPQGATDAPASATTNDEYSTPIPSGATDTAQPEQSTLSKVGDVAEDVGTGFVKGAGQTVNTISGLVSKVAPSLVRPSDVQGLEQIETPTNTAQKVGSIAEQISEFFLGDEALKGLSLADRAGMLAKVAKVAEEHPVVAAIIKKGFQAVRQGTATAGQQLLHGTSLSDAAETGAEAAGAGALAGAGVEGIGAAYSKLQKVFNTKTIQPILQSGIRDVMNAVADENGVERPIDNMSIRDVVKDVADKVEAKVHSMYQELDAASGGRLQRFDDALKNINNELRNVTGLDDAREAELLEKKTSTEAARAQALQNVDPKKIEDAKAAWKQSQALQDFNNKLDMKSVVKGQHPSENIASINPKPTGETVNPDMLHGNLKMLEKTGRLQEAVGEQHAQELTSHADLAAKTRQNILRNQKLAKAAAGVAGIGYGVTHIFHPGVGVLPVE